MLHQSVRILQDHGHAHVVDGGTGRQLDSPIRCGAPLNSHTSPPAGQVEDLTQAGAHISHSRCPGRRADGRYSTWQPSKRRATGVVNRMGPPGRRAYTPEEIREWLHARLAEASATPWAAPCNSEP